MNQKWDAEELRSIKEKVSQGFISEIALREVEEVLKGMESALLQQFTLPNPIYYQNLDNSPFLVLHLKVRVIRELLDTLRIRVDTGRTALEQKAELEEQGVKFND